MKIFLTGGTGTLGQSLIKTLPYDFVVLSRDELKQAHAYQRPGVSYVLGDVRDYGTVLEAMRGCDAVIHAAAMKRIEACEKFPNECRLTNVHGSYNVAAAANTLDIDNTLAISTDKAVKPINTYGYSKAMMESFFLTRKFKVIRYGNVVASRGSVIEKWRNLKEDEVAFVTDITATRFWLPIEEAVKEVDATLRSGLAGEVTIPRMKSASLGDLLAAMNVSNYEEIGLSKFEKQHEDIAEDLNSDNAERFSLEELRELTKQGDLNE